MIREFLRLGLLAEEINDRGGRILIDIDGHQTEIILFQDKIQDENTRD